MPAPFTNSWDQNFPADTGLVSQGAANLRQLRLDTQQRMAAISGLDAAKPSFAADSQPMQWQGVLFFALDTGKVYQFSGTAWTDVTSSIGSGLGSATTISVVDKNTQSITRTNTTTEAVVFTSNIPILQTSSVLRITTNFVVDTWSAQFNVIWRWNGVQILSAQYPSGIGGTVVGSQLFIANRTVLNSQQWNAYFTTAPSGQFQGGTSGAAVGETGIDTSAQTVLTFSVADSGAGNTQTFNLWLVESL